VEHEGACLNLHRHSAGKGAKGVKIAGRNADHHRNAARDCRSNRIAKAAAFGFHLAEFVDEKNVRAALQRCLRKLHSAHQRIGIKTAPPRAAATIFRKGKRSLHPQNLQPHIAAVRRGAVVGIVIQMFNDACRRFAACSDRMRDGRQERPWLRVTCFIDKRGDWRFGHNFIQHHGRLRTVRHSRMQPAGVRG